MLRKHRRALSLSVAVILFIVGLGVVWWRQSGSSEPAPEPQQPGSSSRPGLTPAVAPGLPAQKQSDGTRAWIPGMLYRYAVMADQKVTFANTTPSGVEESTLPGMHLTLQGEWSVGVVAVDGERIDARVNLKLSSFQLSAEDKDVLDPEVRRTLTRALEMPFFLSLARSGSVSLTHFEEGVDDLSRGVLRTLVASSQFVVQGVPGASWPAEEHDTTGQYLAMYQRQAGNRFEKTKQSYTHVATPEGLVPLGSDIRISVNTRAAFELGEDLWTQSLQSKEHLEVDTSAGLPAARTDLELSLRLLERRMDPSLLRSLEMRRGMLSTAPLASFQGLPQDPMNHYRQVLGNKTFEDILKELRSLPEEEKARDDARTRALEQLRALFMLKPDEALKVPDILRSGISPLAASPMLGALSAASTPQAIQSLVTASGDQALSSDVRMDAVSALGMAGEPTREGVDALRNLSRGDQDPMLRDTATLAFGNAAFQMSDSDARGAEALVYELGNDYRTASTPEQQAMVLRSMGNTRAPGTLDTIREGLRSSSVLVREAAVSALRNIPGPEVDQLLSERLLTDPATQVRRGVVFACGFRPLGLLLPALGQALRTDKSDAVRSDLIQLLGSVRGSVPEAMALLGWASQNEPHPELRNMATVFLNTSTTPVPTQPDTTPTR